MKKTLFIFLAFLYLGTSSGFAMHFHYCMGNLIGTSLVEDSLKDCENCGMERSNTKDNGCCKEEYKQLKVDKSEQVNNLSLKLLQNVAIILPPATYEIPAFLQLSTSAADYPNVNSPPKDTTVPVYLRNCVFRI